MSMVNITIRKKVGPGIIHIGFPLWAVWLLLLPVGILMLPVLLLVSLVRFMHPFRIIGIFLGILRALKGTEVELHDRRQVVAIGIH